MKTQNGFTLLENKKDVKESDNMTKCDGKEKNNL